MSRKGQRKPRAGRAAPRPGVEALDERLLPSAIGFVEGLGFGVTGQYSAIHSNAVATDSSGDTYVTGSFRGTATFNPAAQSSTIATNNTQDTFVAKYGPTGNLIWVETFQGQATTNSGFTTYAVSQGSAIAVDGSGDVFLSGSFSGTVQLAGVSGTITISTALATTEPFIAKLSPSGLVSWVDVVSGTTYDDDESYALALDGSGGAVFAGSFEDSATFGSTKLTASGVFDAFAARVNSSGTFLWAIDTRGTGGSNAEVHGLAVDSSGNVDLDGWYSGTVDFNPASGTSNLVSAGSDDAFVWKLDPNGNFLWAKSFGSKDYDAATAIAVDTSGDVYATGAFSDTVTFGTTSLTAGPDYDVFVLELNSSGSVVWADGLVGPGGSSKGQGIAVDSSGNVDVGGTFSGEVDFDPGSSTDDLTSVGSSDAFIADLTSSGSLIYALQAGTTNFNAALGVAVNASGLVSITGDYSGSIAFGPTEVAADGIASAFAAQVTTQTSANPTPPAPSAPVLKASSDSGSSQTDGITNVTSPVFLVNTAVSGDTVELLRNGTVVARRTGPGAIQDPGPPTNGTYSYTAIQVSPSGTASPASAATSVTILTTPPAAPPAPTLYPADDSGTSGDDVTNVRQPRLSVTAPANSTIQLVNQATGAVIGSAAAASAGAVLVPISQSLSDGTYAIQARAIDVAGNVGALGAALTLTILGTPPPAPSAPSILAADDSGGPNLTDVRQPRLTGTAEANATVQILGPTGTVYGTGTVGSNGVYTVKMTNALADGTYSLHAVATDVAGNVSPAGPALSLTIDTTPPAAPTTPALLAADDSGTVGDGITNVRQPRLAATATPGLTVRLLNASNVAIGSATASASGSVTVSPSSPLNDGTYTLDLVEVDAAGNVSSPSGTLTLVILGTPPAKPSAPTLLATDDTGALNDGMTSVTRPILVGTAAPNGRVDWVEANGTVLTSTTASSSGYYQLQPPTALVNGTYAVSVRETDVAGNVSPTSAAFNLRINVVPGDDFADNTSTDVGALQSSPSYYLLQRPNVGAYYIPYAQAGDVPVDGDFWGDGYNDLAFYRPSTSTFFAYDLKTAQSMVVQLGQAGDIPVPADYEGDGETDFAVFQPSNETWYYKLSTTGSVSSFQYGFPGDIPVPGDYLGDGHAEFTVYNQANSTFYAYSPITLDYRQATLGAPNSIPVPADFEGIGHDEFAVFQPANLTWVILQDSSNKVISKGWGIPGDYPVLGDFFGDGQDGLTVYRSSDATFFELDLTTGAVKVASFLGTPSSFKPLLAPITEWFAFSGIASARVISRAIAATDPTSTAGMLETLAPDPAETSTTPAADPDSTTDSEDKASASGRSIDPLSLESWKSKL